uniref:Uncharacterized protein n=1 Tax=Micrurus paraensis TaxID=1970185 RepID=A0A2D4KHU4_9SAUR
MLLTQPFAINTGEGESLRTRDSETLFFFFQRRGNELSCSVIFLEHGVTFGSLPQRGSKKNKNMKPIDFSHIEYTTEEGRDRGGNSRCKDHPEARGVISISKAFHIPEGGGELIAFGEALEGGLCRWVSL